MPGQRPDIEATDPDYSSDKSSNDAYHTEDATRNMSFSEPARRASVAARLRNPLAGMSEADVIRDVDAWVDDKGLTEFKTEFRKGALIARVGQREDGFEYVDQLSEEEKQLLRHEVTHRWDHPFMLYFLVVLCAGKINILGNFGTKGC